jgi:putative MATE family efflux protein
MAKAVELKKKVSLNGNARHRINSIFRNLGLAVRGVEIDYTTVPLKRAILFLALPMVLEMAMESVFVVVDVFFVAKLGPDAVAAVGLTDSVITLVYAIAVGLAMAITAVVARRIGEKKPEKASYTAFQAIFLGIIISIPIAFLGIFQGKNILRLMGASEGVIQIGSGYTTILISGSVVIMLLFICNAIFRGAGDAILAMRALWLANLINIVLDPCLIFGWGPFPELGVSGAAVATTTGRGFGVVFQLWILFSGRSRVKLLKHHVALRIKLIARLLRVSFGGLLQYLIATASWIGIVRIISLFGSTVVAGYTIAVRIIIFSILPAWGISNAASTLVGQNLGADNPDRAEKATWSVAYINLIFLGLISLLFIVFPDALTRIFTDDPGVIRHANDCLRFISFGYALMAFGMVMVHAFNGAGDTYTPSLINLFCYWMFQIPVAYILAVPVGMEARGVFVAIALAETLLGVVALAFFRRGKWKLKKV